MAIHYCGYQTRSFWRITGVQATIMTRRAALGEAPGAASAAWINLLSRREAAGNSWLQMGYANYRVGKTAKLQAYVEGNFAAGTQYIGDVTDGTFYTYRIQRDRNAPGMWYYYLDNENQGPSPHPVGWLPNEFTYVQFYGEEQENSQTVGSEEEPCIFKDCKIQVAFEDNWRDINLNADYEKHVDNVWDGAEIRSGNRFHIYGP